MKDRNKEDNRIFTSHMKGYEPISIKPVGDWKKKNILYINRETLNDLRKEYRRIAKLCCNFKYVLSFACGGCPILIYSAKNEYSRQPDIKKFESVKNKFHLFPGLSWCNNSKIPFVDFIKKLDNNVSILIIDCSFTGQAFASIIKQIKDLAHSQKLPNYCTFVIDGMIDKKRFDKNKVCLKNDVIKHPNGIIKIQINVTFVSNLVYEDFSELIGYEALREHLHLKPLWSPGILVVEDSKTERYHIIAAQPFYGTINGIISNQKELTEDDFNIPKDELNYWCSSTMLMVLKNRFDREYNALKKRNLDANLFLKKIGKLCGEWKKELNRVNKEFSTESIEWTPKCCKSIKKQKTILREEYIDIQIEKTNNDNFFMITIFVAYIDKKGKQRTNFAMLLDNNQLCIMILSDKKIDELIPNIYKSEFNEFWNSIKKNQKSNILDKWNELKSKFRSRL